MEEIWQLAHGAQHVAALYTGGKEIQPGVYIFYESLPSAEEVPVRSRTSIVLCADNPFSFYFSIQTEPYPWRQEGRRFERRPQFLANSLSLRQMTHSPGSFSSHNDGCYKDLRSFAVSLLVHLGPLFGSSTR